MVVFGGDGCELLSRHQSTVIFKDTVCGLDMRSFCYSLDFDIGRELRVGKLFWPTVRGLLVFLTGSLLS